MPAEAFLAGDILSLVHQIGVNPPADCTAAIMSDAQAEPGQRREHREIATI